MSVVRGSRTLICFHTFIFLPMQLFILMLHLLTVLLAELIPERLILLSDDSLALTDDRFDKLLLLDVVLLLMPVAGLI